jgi:hypothetical protein
VRRLTATEAARRFSNLLDQVEHDGEAVKELLRAGAVDDRWRDDLAALRAGVEGGDPHWNA